MRTTSDPIWTGAYVPHGVTSGVAQPGSIPFTVGLPSTGRYDVRLAGMTVLAATVAAGVNNPATARINAPVGSYFQVSADNLSNAPINNSFHFTACVRRTGA